MNSGKQLNNWAIVVATSQLKIPGSSLELELLLKWRFTFFFNHPDVSNVSMDEVGIKNKVVIVDERVTQSLNTLIATPEKLYIHAII